MKHEQLIPIQTLCKHYKVETSFFTGLNDHGLIEITTIEQSSCIHEEHIPDVEKMIRLHQDLNINIEGIDTVLNLLERIEHLKSELHSIKRRLGVYE